MLSHCCFFIYPFFHNSFVSSLIQALSHCLSLELSNNLTLDTHIFFISFIPKAPSAISEFFDLIMFLQCQPSMAPTACRVNYKSIPLQLNPVLTSISSLRSSPPPAPCQCQNKHSTVARPNLCSAISSPHVISLHISAST